MTEYSYHNSLIERIEFRHARGSTQASIYTHAQDTPESLADLRRKLGAQSLSTLMDEVDGRAVIQVRGLEDEQALFTALSNIDRSAGGGKDSVSPEKPAGGFRERVRGKSLFLSALFYDLGNVALMVSGVQRGRHNPDGKLTRHDRSEIWTGAAFSVGDILMTLYGDKKGDEQLEAFANNLKKHLHQKHIEIPAGDALTQDSLHQSGTYKATDRWLRKHIIQIKCATEMAGGLYMTHAALKPGNLNKGKLLAGFLLSTGWLSTLLLDKSHKTVFFHGTEQPDGLFEKIKDNPRGLIARPLAMANNVSNFVGSYHERARLHRDMQDAEKAFHAHPTEANEAQLSHARGKQHDYVWNVFSASAFLVAHTLFGMSGEKRPNATEDDKAMMEDLVLLSANMLAQQPEAIRTQVVEETADYIARLPHVEQSKEQVAAAINDKVASLEHGSWTKKLASGQAAGEQGIA